MRRALRGAAHLQVWSICFTGWPGCLLLLWACVIWMARDPCRLALRSAPFLVGYANILIILSFVAGLRVSREELFPGAPDWLLADLDLKPYLQPCLHLGAKVSSGDGDGARDLTFQKRLQLRAGDSGPWGRRRRQGRGGSTLAQLPALGDPVCLRLHAARCRGNIMSTSSLTPIVSEGHG